MGAAIKLITMTEEEIEAMMERVCERTMTRVLAAQDDELLNVGQLCERLPGLTRYTFSKLIVKTRLKDVQGKYSLKAVKAALQSR